MFLALLIISSLTVAHTSNPLSSFAHAVFGPLPNDSCVPESNDYCHVANAVHEWVSSGQLANNLREVIAIIPKGATLNDILAFVLQKLSQTVEYRPELQSNDYLDVYRTLTKIVSLLRDTGSSGVIWEDISPLIQRFLHYIPQE